MNDCQKIRRSIVDSLREGLRVADSIDTADLAVFDDRLAFHLIELSEKIVQAYAPPASAVGE